MGTPELICDGINEYNSDGNFEGFTVGLIEGVTLVRFDSTMLGFTDFSKLGEEIVFKEGV